MVRSKAPPSGQHILKGNLQFSKKFVVKYYNFITFKQGLLQFSSFLQLRMSIIGI